MSELILYTSDDGQTRLQLRAEGGTVWLAQAEIADLFLTTPQNITIHLRSIYDEGEAEAGATCKESLQVRHEGEREVRRSIKLYNLDVILAIGYRVRSPRGTEFRRWATTHLREYLVKGFVIDAERLKEPGSGPGGVDYFDELLAGIRDIRASEKRFYQKVRDLFALSRDYRGSEKETGLFFADVQNKLLYAATDHTAAELIVRRADPDQPNMNLTAWKGARVRKEDVVIAKNYLTADEIDTLNRLVVIFLEQAELRVKRRKDLTLDYWRQNVDQMLAFNDRPVLDGLGTVSNKRMKRVAFERYEAFDDQRRLLEAQAADAEDLKQIEELERKVKKKKGKGAS